MSNYTNKALALFITLVRLGIIEVSYISKLENANKILNAHAFGRFDKHKK